MSDPLLLVSLNVPGNSACMDMTFAKIADCDGASPGKRSEGEKAQYFAAAGDEDRPWHVQGFSQVRLCNSSHEAKKSYRSLLAKARFLDD